MTLLHQAAQKAAFADTTLRDAVQFLSEGLDSMSPIQRAATASLLRAVSTLQQQPEPVAELERWGVKHEGGSQWFERVADGYWTPWHIAHQALAAPPALQQQEVSNDWQAKAVAWLRAKADEQEATSRKYPRHADAYASWNERVKWWRRAADDLERAASPSTTRQQEAGSEPAMSDRVRWALAAFNRAKREQHADDVQAMHAALLAATPSTPENAGGVATGYDGVTTHPEFGGNGGVVVGTIGHTIPPGGIGPATAALGVKDGPK